MNLDSVLAFLADMERLKLVQRRAYVSDLSRHENSAEHSWHMAIGLLTVARELNLNIDLSRDSVRRYAATTASWPRTFAVTPTGCR